MRWCDADRRGRAEQGAHGLLVSEPVEQARPLLPPGKALAHLIEHLDPRWQTRLDGVLGQQALAKAVDRRDHRLVEVVEGVLEAARRPLVRLPRRHLVIQSASQAELQIHRRRLGESDRGYTVEIRGAGSDDLDNPGNERGRLARSRSSLYEQGRIKLAGDDLASSFLTERRVLELSRHRLCPVTSSA